MTPQVALLSCKMPSNGCQLDTDSMTAVGPFNGRDFRHNTGDGMQEWSNRYVTKCVLCTLENLRKSREEQIDLRQGPIHMYGSEGDDRQGHVNGQA